jgi:hypothetical protein
MIPRFSGRPGQLPAGRQSRDQQAADIFRRFFHALERLDSRALRELSEAMAQGAPETKGKAATRRKRAPANPKAGRVAE